MIEPARSNPPMSRLPFVPEITPEESVASGINVNLLVLSSKPKKPSFAAEPLCHLNSIPLSRLSSEPGAESHLRIYTVGAHDPTNGLGE